MTTTEELCRIADKYKPISLAELKPHLDRIVESAILAEREVCAKICDDLAEWWVGEALRLEKNQFAVLSANARSDNAYTLATQIRARSNPAPETEKEITVRMPPKSRQAGVFIPGPAQTIDSKENIAPDPVSA